jgi:predicted dinucleotide-binding enzyme
MSSITIIGTGNMAKALGGGASAGTFGAAPAGEIVILASAYVVKALTAVFRHVLTQGRPVDVFLAGEDAQAKASVSTFIESLGLRPRDTGDLSIAHWLEGAGVLTMGLARYGVGNFDFSLGINSLEGASR